MKRCAFLDLINSVMEGHTKLRLLMSYFDLFHYIIIISIKKGRQCKAEREWCTPYQSEDPAPQYQPIDRKKRKGKRVEDYSRDRAA